MRVLAEIIRLFGERAAEFPADIPAEDPRLLKIALELKGLKPGPVLDAGCGKGRFMRALRAVRPMIVGMDPVMELLREAGGGAPLVCAEASRQPFADGSLAAVICVEVLEHVEDLKAPLAEFYRILSPGGRLIIIDKNLHSIYHNWPLPAALLKARAEKRGGWFYPASFPFREKWFTRAGLSRDLEKAGFAVKSGYIPFHKKPWHRLFPFTELFICWTGVK